ncbi:MAG: hypothetical protein ACLPY1_22875, partial [Terracidiphilus sp.]
LRNPGETLPADDNKDARVGVMKPVQFPKPKPPAQPGENPDGPPPDAQPPANTPSPPAARPAQPQPPVSTPPTQPN